MLTVRNDFLTNVIGTAPLGELLASIFYAFVGAFMLMLSQAATRDPLTKRTPFCWQWSYFFNDNTKRMLRNLFFIVIAVRFSQEFLGAKATMYGAFLIGLGSDKISELFMTKKEQQKKQDTETLPIEP